MSIFTGCTILPVLPHHDPNIGRSIINDNFDCLVECVTFSISGSTTANTIVQGAPGGNITVTSSGATVPPIYTAVLDNDIIVSSVSAVTMSATTMFSGNTDVSNLFVSQVPASVQQVVAATGDAVTTGTGTPTVTSYDVGTIYITTFDTTNTVTGTSINIDGVGVTNIEKYSYDLSGFTTLDVGEIVAGVQSFLTYDGSRFQFSVTNPDSSGGNYTTPSAIPITLGGVDVGTTYANTPISEVFDELFFPFLKPVFSSFKINSQSTLLEVGNTVVSGSKTFSWGTTNSSFVSPNTITIKDVTGGNVIISTPTSGMTNDGSEIISIGSVTKTTPAQHRWQIRAVRTNASAFARNFNVNWRWRVYYGTSALTGLTSAQITGLTSSQLDTTIINDDWSYVAGDYKYLCIPSTFSSPSLFKDESTNLSVAMASDPEGYTEGSGTYKYITVNVMNQYGVSQDYRVYRTRNSLGGSIDIKTT